MLTAGGWGPAGALLIFATCCSFAQTATPTFLSFSYQQGAQLPSPQDVTIANPLAVSFTVSTASNPAGWLVVNPAAATTPAVLAISINPPGLAPGMYTGIVTVIFPAGETFYPSVTVSVQLSVTASLVANPTALTFQYQIGGAPPAPQTVSVASTSSPITFTARGDISNSWLHVPLSPMTTPANLTISVDPSNSPYPPLAPGVYTGSITLAPATFGTGPAPQQIRVTFTVLAAAPPLPSPPSVTSVLNAASYTQVGISPGEIVTITGTGIGPKILAGFVLDTNGRVASQVAGSQVLFDGTPAPLIYTSDLQVSAVVPYEVAGQNTTNVQVVYNGLKSSVVPVQVVGSAPGLFTLDSSGIGQGAILNQDSTVNSFQNPADRGSVVTLYATGEGQTTPGGVDGQLANSTLPKPLLPVSVQIGGLPAQIMYAGAAPTIVSGLMQVNAVVPQNAPAGGAVPVNLTVGTASSQQRVTVAIKQLASVQLSFFPNPVQQSSDGQWRYQVTLQETGGVGVVFTSLMIDGVDRTDLLNSAFTSTRLAAHGTLFGNIQSSTCGPCTTPSTWVLAGYDNAGHTGLTWTGTVRLLPTPANVQISFSPNPVHQAADGSWRFSLTVSETSGVGVTFMGATRTVYGVAEDDTGLFSFLGSNRLPGGGQLSTPSENTSCNPGAICPLPLDITYTLIGKDDNGNTGLSWSGTVRLTQ